ncbi:MAG: helix-turn-helix domain-containing protein [Candidatus Bathyarchaeia archaeon]
MCDATLWNHAKSRLNHGDTHMLDVFLVILVAFGATMLGVAVYHYHLILKVQKEYKKSKEVVEEIVLSFNRQLKNEATKIETLAYRVEALASRSDRALRVSEETASTIKMVVDKVATVEAANGKMLEKVEEIEKKVCDVVTSQVTLNEKITSVEERVRQPTLLPEANVEAVIPIRRDKALAPLNETEVTVLEMLAAEGSKTAPEIKERLKLSREHTARLMKKLYEGGYLERETGKIPFRYSVKKEMEKFLKKAESPA